MQNRFGIRKLCNQQKYVKPLSSYEIFVANIEAGNEEQLIIKGIVESYNMFISPTKIPGAICAISTIEYIFRKFGYHILDNTLGLCVATWEGDVNSFSGNMLKGVAKLLVAYGTELDLNIFKEKLGRASIKANGSLGYAEAMLNIYNKRLRCPLQFSKLYNKKRVVLPNYSDNREEYFGNNDSSLEEAEECK